MTPQEESFTAHRLLFGAVALLRELRDGSLNDADWVSVDELIEEADEFLGEEN